MLKNLKEKLATTTVLALEKMNFSKKSLIKISKNLPIFATALIATNVVGLNEAEATDGAAATTEIADTETTATSVVAGLLESNATATVTYTISGTSTLGALGGKDAIGVTEDSNTEILTITQTGASVATLAGDVEIGSGSADVINYLQTGAGTTLVQGNLVHNNAANVTHIILGVASASTSHVLTIDNAADEDQTWSKVDTIKGADASDTITVNITSSLAGAADNTTTIGGVFGGAGNAAIDALNIGSTDNQTVIAKFDGTALTATAITLGNTGATADAITFSVDTLTSADLTVTGAINAANATDNVTLAIAGDDANTITFASDIGTGIAGTIDTVTVGAQDDNVDVNATFNGSLVAGAITIGNTNTSNADIYVVNFITAGAETITGVVTEARAADVTTLNFQDSTDGAVADLITVSSAVTVDTINVGDTAISGNVKFDSLVTSTIMVVDGGSGTAEASAVDLAAGHTGELNLDKNTNDATATYSGAVATSQTGIVHAVTDGDGKVAVTNTVGTTFTLGIGTGIGVGEIEVGATGVAIFNGVNDTQLLDIDGTATIKLDAQVADDIDFAATARVYLDDATIVTTDTIFTLADGGDATMIVDGAKIYMPINLDKGHVLNLFTNVLDAQITAIIADTEGAVHDNPVLNYTAAVGATADDVKVTAVARSAADVASTYGVTVSQGAAISQAYTAAVATSGDSGAYSAFETSFNSDAATQTELVKQLAPQMDVIGGSSTATRAMTGTVQGIISNRMASLRSGDSSLVGMSAGNHMSANSGFLQAFGSTTEQNNTLKGGSTVPGYDSDTNGIALGFDGMTEDGSVIGLSISASETDVDGKGSGKSTNAIKSMTGSLYFDKPVASGYIEGSLTFGVNDNTSSRKVTAGGLSRTYKSEFDSQQVSLKIGGGVPTELDGGAFVTPFGSLTGTQISADTYTEKSGVASDNLTLKVDADDIDSLIATVGVKVNKVTDMGTPMISLAVNSELGDKTINTSNSYTGGGTAFTTSSDVEELSATLGLGYSYGSDLVSIDLSYEGEVNDDEYLSHYGSVRLVSKF
jgi:hypothetical protein